MQYFYFASVINSNYFHVKGFSYLKYVRGKCQNQNYKSSHQRCSVKKVFRNFAKFVGKHLCQSLFLKRDSGTGVFLWILRIFSDHIFLQNTPGQLLLNIIELLKIARQFACNWLNVGIYTNVKSWITSYH